MKSAPGTVDGTEAFFAPPAPSPRIVHRAGRGVPALPAMRTVSAVGAIAGEMASCSASMRMRYSASTGGPRMSDREAGRLALSGTVMDLVRAASAAQEVTQGARRAVTTAVNLRQRAAGGAGRPGRLGAEDPQNQRMTFDSNCTSVGAAQTPM